MGGAPPCLHEYGSRRLLTVDVMIAQIRLSDRLALLCLTPQ